MRGPHRGSLLTCCSPRPTGFSLPSSSQSPSPLGRACRSNTSLLLELKFISSSLKELSELSLEQCPRKLLVFLSSKWVSPSEASDLPRSLCSPGPQASLSLSHPPHPLLSCPGRVGRENPSLCVASSSPFSSEGSELRGLSHREGGSPEVLQVVLSFRSRRPCPQLYPPLLSATIVSDPGDLGHRTGAERPCMQSLLIGHLGTHGLGQLQTSAAFAARCSQ